MYARFRNVRGIVADLALPATAKVRKKIFMRISTVTICDHQEAAPGKA